jgi:DNA mismatch repair protein MutL
MGRIRVLDETVANQIAAGEVVERPASVVKELVENALDAGAARVTVAIEGGGAARVLVADDGSGMDGEDARLAFERHATSKVRSAEDLRSIASFGFRGEALPSIASVSRTTLVTSTGGPGGGTRVRVAAGRVLAVEPAPHPRGTTVEVAGLFYNAPARRKFLRSPATETAHVAELLARLAACQPAVAFTLTSGGRTLVSWPPAPALRERVAQMVPPGEATALLPVEGGDADLRVTGLASGPAASRSTSRHQHLFVNARPIRDRRLLHAVQEAYATILPRGRYPLLYLFLEMPPDQVDVNVHPAKAEVRFLKAGAVHDLVRRSLEEALGVSRPFYRLREGAAAVAEPSPHAASGVAGRGGAAAGPVAPGGGGPGAGGPRPAAPAAPVPGGVPGAPSVLFDSVPVAPLAQFRDSYILASAPDGLVIVDQHAAHERVLYERLLAQAAAGRIERQRLLFPVVVELSAAQRGAYETGAGALGDLGFGLSAFGEGVVRVEEVPALLAAGDIDRLLRELLDEILEWERAEGMERLRHRILATAACHAAVTANHALDSARMGQIVGDLLRTRRPMTCPHGRPALLRLTLEQLEREFHRR